jgi:hypothetical protein
MGIEILTEDQYRELQRLGKFDTKTSNWISTPFRIRNSAVPSSATAATTPSSSATTAQNPARPFEGFAARS